jgi:formylglycine-generating enzyme required for sulfatase activity
MDGMKQIRIPEGVFLMGITEQVYNEILKSNTDFSNELPQHSVRLNSFWIDEHEVTFGMFVEFLNTHAEEFSLADYINPNLEDIFQDRENSWSVAEESLRQPVYNVYWEGANQYCQWVGGRLPTEAEWERAAKGGIEQVYYPWGNQPPECNLEKSNGALFDSCQIPEPYNVKSFSPNGFQLFDMAGNVWEWVVDWYGPYEDVDQENPQGPITSPEGARVLRGGGAMSNIDYLRTTNRGSDLPQNPLFSDDFVGFRCVVDVVEE